MQIKIQIRKFQQHDLSQVAQLFDAYRQFYEVSSDLTLAENYIADRIKNNESTILVAENSAGGLDGFCQLYPTFCSVIAQPIYVLYDLFVAPSARGKGVAKQLLDASVALAKEHGRARLDLSTAKTNQVAQSVYEANGWIRDNDFYTYNFTL
ncbi:ribosomal protein S18 acetylase RimI-like enzyme [Oxalobacteraceae bacterium GrIS 2.11]